jgi:hypothetical protein
VHTLVRSGDGEAGASQLDEATHSGEPLWRAKVYPEAREVVLWVDRPRPGFTADLTDSWADDVEPVEQRSLLEHDRPVLGPGRFELEDIERQARNRANAARRARGRSRRYCKSNRLTRLGTLTYATPEHDRAAVVAHLNTLARTLRAYFGEAFPYLWVIEEHHSGALHVHIALGRPVAMRCHRCDPDGTGRGLHADDRRGKLPCLPCAWGRGFVMAQRFKNTKGRNAGGAVAAYVAKYVGKDVEHTAPGQKSYDVARGFNPEAVEAESHDVASLLKALCRSYFDDAAPQFTWSSNDVEDWRGPPVRVAFW